MSELQRALWRRSAALTAVIAAGFCLFAASMLVLAVLHQHSDTPLNAPAVRELKAQLAQRPNDGDLKEQLRQLDLDLRAGHWADQSTIRRAAWLLVAAGVTLSLALKAHAALSPRGLVVDIPPLPSPATAAMTRWSLMGIAVVAGAGIAALGLLRAVYLPPPPPTSVAATEVPPTWEQLFANWPSFRGAAGDGVVRQEATLPASWDAPANENVLWKSPVRLPGHGSPIVWNGRLYLSGANDKQREIYCFDARSGASIWTLPLPSEPTRDLDVFADTGYAAPTMACDGRRIYAIFAGGDLFAASFAGELLWQRSFGVPESQYGYASSLAIHKAKVIVQLDQGDASSGKSALFAFDGAGGRPLWRTPRAVGSAWSSPIVAPTRGGDRLFACGNPLVAGYDPADGRELWHAQLLEGDVAPSPIFRDGILYVAGDRAKAAALPDAAGRSGTNTSTRGGAGAGAGAAATVPSERKPLWTSEENLPDIVSPLCDGDNLLLVTSSGTLTCLAVADGHKRWEHDLGAPVQASPLLVGDTVYLTDEHGVTHLFRLAEEDYQESAACPLGEPVSASPAAAAGRLYFRTHANLICIGTKPPATQASPR